MLIRILLLLLLSAFQMGCDSSTNFVGGVVVTNAKPLILQEVMSGDTIEIAENPEGQTSFRFESIAMDTPFNIQIIDDQGQRCSITDNEGIYSGFPVFSTKIQCADDNNVRWSGNPILRNQYTADPTLLAQGDYLYLYAGKDETSFLHLEKERCGTQCFKELTQIAGNFEITGIHIYRTQNMVDWEYVGPAVEAKDVPWMKQTWASHIIEKGGKYFLYTCSPRTDVITNVAFKSIWSLLSGNGIATGPTASTGVAVSDSPDGPFIDIGEPLIRYDHPGSIDAVMDPAAFIDDDGKAYLFFGGGGEAQYVELNDDMVSVKSDILEIVGVDGTDPIPGFTEAAYVHKRNGIYYLSYSKSAVGAPPGPLAYATATNIHGPWTYKGDFLGDVEILTNHGAIYSFKGKDYLFYHNGDLPGISDGPLGLKSFATRAVSVQSLIYEGNGDIRLVPQDIRGIPEIQ